MPVKSEKRWHHFWYTTPFIQLWKFKNIFGVQYSSHSLIDRTLQVSRNVISGMWWCRATQLAVWSQWQHRETWMAVWSKWWQSPRGSREPWQPSYLASLGGKCPWQCTCFKPWQAMQVVVFECSTQQQMLSQCFHPADDADVQQGRQRLPQRPPDWKGFCIWLASVVPDSQRQWDQRGFPIRPGRQSPASWEPARTCSVFCPKATNKDKPWSQFPQWVTIWKTGILAHWLHQLQKFS